PGLPLSDVAQLPAVPLHQAPSIPEVGVVRKRLLETWRKTTDRWPAFDVTVYGHQGVRLVVRGIKHPRRLRRANKRCRLRFLGRRRRGRVRHRLEVVLWVGLSFMRRVEPMLRRESPQLV